MTDHTPAAQATKQVAVLTDADILHHWDAYVGEPSAALPLSDADKIAFARAVESALRSKLRAPVADESPMAKMADVLREKARKEQQAYQDRRNQATEWGPMPEGTEADHPIPNAPVAHVAGNEASRYLEWAKDRSAWEMPVGTPVYYSAMASAPVGGEAVAWRYWNEKSNSWNTTTSAVVADVMRESGRAVEPLFAAPQASEAVRDAGIAVSAQQLVAAAKAMTKLYPHVWDRTDGSLVVFPENVAKFDAAFDALRVALGEAVEDDDSAALSAQPGAQKKGDSDAE